MTDFYDILEQTEDGGFAYNPYSGRNPDGSWIPGAISIDWLNKHFGDLSNIDDMIIRAHEFHEGTVLFFQWLKSEDILP